MLVSRKGVFETNSSSTHVLAVYGGHATPYKPLTIDYFKEAATHIGKYSNFEINDFDLPNEIFSFYDKVRILIALAADSYWDKYGKWDDEWYMPEQVFGEYPFSLFPTIELAVRNVMARRGYEVASIVPGIDSMLYDEPDQKKSNYSIYNTRKIRFIKFNHWVRIDFLDKHDLRSLETIERFLDCPESYIIELDGQSEYYGPALNESEKFEEHYCKVLTNDKD